MCKLTTDTQATATYAQFLLESARVDLKPGPSWTWPAPFWAKWGSYALGITDGPVVQLRKLGRS